MKKFKKTLLILSALSLSATLFSCGEADSNNSSDSGEEAKNTLVSVMELLETLNNEETNNAVSVNVKTSERKNDDVTETEETFSIGSDHSSASQGNITHKRNGAVMTSDTFKRRRLKKTDTIIDNTKSSVYDRIYMVTDYASNTLKSDSMTIYYVFDTEDEATEAGFSSGYVLSENANVATGAQAIGYLHDTLLAQVVNVPSFSAQDDAYFYMTEENGSTKYTYSGVYTEPGDLGDTNTNTVNASFYVKDNRLTSYSYSYKLVDKADGDSDDSNAYISEITQEATINYGDRESISSDINVDDYFLSEVSEVQLYSSGIPGKGYEIEDPSLISQETNYISAAAKVYSPTTALDVTLTPYRSSKQSVVKVDGSYFEVNGKGSADLTFKYLAKTGNNQYSYKTIKVPVTIIGAAPKSFMVIESSNYLNDDTLYLGQTYTLSISTQPSMAEQGYTYTVSDEEAITVTKKDNVLTVVPQKEADDVSIVLTSVDGSLSQTLTYAVKKDPTDDNKAYLSSHTYDAKTRVIGDEDKPMEFGYFYTDFTCSSDGTGYVYYAPYDENKNIIEDQKVKWTFTYTISLAKITFSDFEGPTKTNDQNDQSGLVFTDGIIKNNGARIEIYDANLKQLVFIEK